MQTCYEPLKPDILAPSEMLEDVIYFWYNFAVPHIFNQLQKTPVAPTKRNKPQDDDSEESRSPLVTQGNYDIEFITPLIPVTLPHSLTSSQARSEGQFLVKSPAPPLASAPAGILGSWPLPPPPGRCWYDCGYERLLVGRAGENLQNGPVILWRSTMRCCFSLSNQTLFVNINGTEQRLSSGRSHTSAACFHRRGLNFCFLVNHHTGVSFTKEPPKFVLLHSNTGEASQKSFSLVSQCGVS